MCTHLFLSIRLFTSPHWLYVITLCGPLPLKINNPIWRHGGTAPCMAELPFQVKESNKKTTQKTPSRGQKFSGVKVLRAKSPGGKSPGAGGKCPGGKSPVTLHAD